MLVEIDEETEYITLKHPDAKDSLHYPLVYLPELIEALLEENLGVTFYFQNFGVERTAKSVRLIKSVGKYIPLLVLTSNQAKKLANTLSASFPSYL